MITEPTARALLALSTHRFTAPEQFAEVLWGGRDTFQTERRSLHGGTRQQRLARLGTSQLGKLCKRGLIQIGRVRTRDGLQYHYWLTLAGQAALTEYTRTEAARAQGETTDS